MDKFVQSSEVYKGYTLNVVMKRDVNHPSHYFRQCDVLKDGKRIGINKTKKSAKADIDDGVY